ncbi:MAG: hypothetical protein LBR70_06060 [Lactobacillaceae bacterium]|jgi:F-type H+-transporting ATPase subunit b|nr:hypothetical protein [Lactobacillaceae bacterium]
MPQLDPGSFASQVFWLLICFISLYFIVSTFFTPKMDGILNKRQKTIDSHIEKAKKHKEKANKLFEQYEDALDEAHNKASESFEKALKELKAYIEDKKVSLQSELYDYTKKMQESVRKDKEKALGEINLTAVGLANEIAAKIGLRGLSEKNLEKNIKDNNS